jgi:hypothetical protein
MNVVGIKSENESLTALLYLSRDVSARERERESSLSIYMRSIRFDDDDAARQCAAFYYVAHTAAAGAHSAGVFCVSVMDGPCGVAVSILYRQSSSAAQHHMMVFVV